MFEKITGTIIETVTVEREVAIVAEDFDPTDNEATIKLLSEYDLDIDDEIGDRDIVEQIQDAVSSIFEAISTAHGIPPIDDDGILLHDIMCEAEANMYDFLETGLDEEEINDMTYLVFTVKDVVGLINDAAAYIESEELEDELEGEEE